MSLGLKPGALDLEPYNPEWAAAFAALFASLTEALPEGTEIHHIGSTAVPGLPAKPILDLAVISDAHDSITATLADLGWIDRHRRSGHLFIRMDGELRTHNLHLYRFDEPEWRPQIAFRDRLRADPALRDAYAADKARIIAEGTPRRDYADAKGAFIAKALAV